MQCTGVADRAEFPIENHQRQPGDCGRYASISSAATALQNRRTSPRVGKHTHFPHTLIRHSSGRIRRSPNAHDVCRCPIRRKPIDSSHCSVTGSSSSLRTKFSSSFATTPIIRQHAKSSSSLSGSLMPLYAIFTAYSAAVRISALVGSGITINCTGAAGHAATAIEVHWRPPSELGRSTASCSPSGSDQPTPECRPVR